MSYVIEAGVPIPQSKGGRRVYRPKSDVAIALDALNVGESFLMDSHDEYIQSRGLFTKYIDRRYATRKTGEGWRIWRTE